MWELDENGYAHNTTDGWITTLEPLTPEQILRFKANEMTLDELWALPNDADEQERRRARE
jgi:hypothetical protein